MQWIQLRVAGFLALIWFCWPVYYVMQRATQRVAGFVTLMWLVYYVMQQATQRVAGFIALI